jgi:hypothetical protein
LAPLSAKLSSVTATMIIGSRVSTRPLNGAR